MTCRNIWQILIAANLFVLSALCSSTADVVRTDLSELKMRADHKSVSAGDAFQIIIELTPDQGWHAYWENPGDAGLKLEMDWTAPEGVEIGNLQFTTPHLIPFEEIVSYGYDGKVTILADARITDDIDVSALNISGNAFWLVCSDALCVPQEAKIGFSLPVGESVIDARLTALADATKAQMPLSADWQGQFYTDGENFTVKAAIPTEYPVIESAYLFPHTEGMMENVYRQDLSFVDGNIIGRFKNAYGYADNEEFKFLLSFKTGGGEEKSYLITAVKTETPLASVRDEVVAEQPKMTSELGLLLALSFAFVGGLILNLMPCVFPILSLKAMSVVELSNKHPREARLSGLLYTGGVIVSFGVIGLVVNGLSLGWGFHMQMPIVNFTLGLLMVLIGLNLLGVFEFNSTISGLGQGLVQNNESNGANRRATFFTGVLAVVVATPCTAPFMASALGYAFINGGLGGFLVFLALGFGLAFPYLLLCYVPTFRRVLPRPGAWMETMRNILGFPMLATALWLYWILGNQIGVNAMAVSLAASLFLALSVWSFSKNKTVWKLLSGASLLVVLYFGYVVSNMNVENRIIASDEGGLNAVAFNSKDLKELVDKKEAVFVYFTADWCVTCKLNERNALSSPEVHKAFRDNDISVMVGDWTNQNPDITKTLQSYGRIGVPLYLYFSEDRNLSNPMILPQILTTDIIVDAL